MLRRALLCAFVVASSCESASAFKRSRRPTLTSPARSLDGDKQTSALLASRPVGVASLMAPDADLESPVPKHAPRPSFYWAVLHNWLYFLALGLSIPVLGRVISTIVNPDGSPKVSSASSVLGGDVEALDKVITFMCVGFLGALSDVHGRRPLMAYSALGFATTCWLQATARKSTSVLYLADVVDGVSSCMSTVCQCAAARAALAAPRAGRAPPPPSLPSPPLLSGADPPPRSARLARLTSRPCTQRARARRRRAYVADASTPDRRAANIGVFQGLSVAGAFILGFPLSAIISAKYGLRAPMHAAAAVGVLNFLIIVLFTPESLPAAQRVGKKLDLAQANPIGALRLLFRRSPLMAGSAATFFLVWLSNTCINSQFGNYVNHLFDWGPEQARAWAPCGATRLRPPASHPSLAARPEPPAPPRPPLAPVRATPRADRHRARPRPALPRADARAAPLHRDRRPRLLGWPARHSPLVHANLARLLRAIHVRRLHMHRLPRGVHRKPGGARGAWGSPGRGGDSAGAVRGDRAPDVRANLRLLHLRRGAGQAPRRAIPPRLGPLPRSTRRHSAHVCPLPDCRGAVLVSTFAAPRAASVRVAAHARPALRGCGSVALA